MSTERIGGEDAVGNVGLTVIGAAFTIPNGRLLQINHVDLAGEGQSRLVLEESTDGGTVFTAIMDWELAARGHLNLSYTPSPVYQGRGDATGQRRVRLRYIQGVAAAIRARVTGDLSP